MSEMGRSLGVRKQAVLQTFLDSWGRSYLLREPNERIECGRCGKQFSCDQVDVGAHFGQKWQRGRLLPQFRTASRHFFRPGYIGVRYSRGARGMLGVTGFTM